MQYILTEEEFKSFIPYSKHQEIRNCLLDMIERCNKELLKDHECWKDSGFDSFCDNCPIGAIGSNSCDRTDKRYSK